MSCSRRCAAGTPSLPVAWRRAVTGYVRSTPRSPAKSRELTSAESAAEAQRIRALPRTDAPADFVCPSTHRATAYPGGDVADFFEFVPGYSHYIYRAGREPLFFLLLAFLLTFAVARSYTRLGRLRGWRSGTVRGVHLHHLVPGIVASLVAGTAIIGFRPGDDTMLLLSMLFGVGAALTLDEFALILHLDDVYWTDEGRSSIEATLMGAAFGILCLLASLPLSGDPRQDSPHWLAGAVLAVNLSFGLIAFL